MPTISDVTTFQEHAIIIKNKVTGTGSVSCAPTKAFIGWNDGAMVNVAVKDNASPGDGKIVAGPSGSGLWSYDNPAYPQNLRLDASAWDEDGNPTNYLNPDGTQVSKQPPDNRGYNGDGWYLLVQWFGGNQAVAYNAGGPFGYYIARPGYPVPPMPGTFTNDPESYESSWIYIHNFGATMNPGLTKNIGGATTEWLDSSTLKITKEFTQPGQECTYIRIDASELIPSL